jgi:hypothetical protein
MRVEWARRTPRRRGKTADSVLFLVHAPTPGMRTERSSVRGDAGESAVGRAELSPGRDAGGSPAPVTGRGRLLQPEGADHALGDATALVVVRGSAQGDVRSVGWGVQCGLPAINDVLERRMPPAGRPAFGARSWLRSGPADGASRSLRSSPPAGAAHHARPHRCAARRGCLRARRGPVSGAAPCTGVAALDRAGAT